MLLKDEYQAPGGICINLHSRVNVHFLQSIISGQLIPPFPFTTEYGIIVHPPTLHTSSLHDGVFSYPLTFVVYIDLLINLSTLG